MRLLNIYYMAKAMTDLKPIKLLAFDAEDLTIVSAQVQDAVCKIGDLNFDAAKNLLTLEINRLSADKKQRRRAALVFSRILSVRSKGIDRNRPDDVLALLAVLFKPNDAPAGTIILVFAGGATLELNAECIEVQLADSDAIWAAGIKPRHKI